MKRLDLIIEAIRLAEYHVKAKGWGDDVDLELYTEALAAARELRELEPVAWKGRKYHRLRHKDWGNDIPLYALGDEK